jgi:hypothetical protein
VAETQNKGSKERRRGLTTKEGLDLTKQTQKQVLLL